ncbi:hypothetical protein BU24DRAFT_25852 [Aaosphaeria arxii CBS 175.79]|uniref:Uncharacterized protein n=1 Tax=Aaosphaeria arxii CBS 175.79 TaxID=1450172 RepID=A0A6A5Y8P1_9PLEO|nr:uncharacterized protein BU24DRAFT_25852 [Aaosphaeria arxii CBS 175.79]KAF2021699.1 hypothetical protein BU24DRAFT_25852 [Aaosphaeria arxii CBS 175.79]
MRTFHKPALAWCTLPLSHSKHPPVALCLFLIANTRRCALPVSYSEHPPLRFTNLQRSFRTCSNFELQHHHLLHIALAHCALKSPSNYNFLLTLSTDGSCYLLRDSHQPRNVGHYTSQ